jgi:hypothetical protein
VCGRTEEGIYYICSINTTYNNFLFSCLIHTYIHTCTEILCHSTLQKAPFGYSRKDVILIGLGVTFLGIALKSGLEVPFFLSALIISMLTLSVSYTFVPYHIF